MAYPRTVRANRRRDLEATLMEFDLLADRLGFIGLKVLPPVPVSEQSGQYPFIPLKELLKETGDGKRAPTGGYQRDDIRFDYKDFATTEYGYEGRVDDREAKIYRHFFDHEAVIANRTLDQLLRRQERRIAAKVFDTNVFTVGNGNFTAPAIDWIDANGAPTAGGKPIDDVEAAVRAKYNKTGIWSNALIISRFLFRALRNNQQILDRVAALGAGDRTLPTDITVEKLAQAFDLKYILVAGGAKNTANEAANATIAEIWDRKYAMVATIAESADASEPALGRTFTWSEDSDFPYTIETYEEDQTRGEVVRVRQECQEQLIEKFQGHLLDVGP